MSQTNLVNICGVLVRTIPDSLGFVSKALSQLQGVEVHSQSLEGKIVVTVEENNQKMISQIIESFNDIKGVVATSLVYQHSE